MNTGIYESGWVCPKCGAVMSPRESVCVNCRGDCKTNLAVNSTSGYFDGVSVYDPIMQGYERIKNDAQSND